MRRRLLALLLAAGSVPLLSRAPLHWPLTAQAQERFGYRVKMDSRAQAPLEVTFTTDPTPYRVVWRFGDGQSGAGQQTQHIYYRPGTYTFVVELYDDAGQQRMSGEGQLTVKSAGPEKANLVILIGRGEVRLSHTGSVIYAPSTPNFVFDGRPATPSPLKAVSGIHLAGVKVQGQNGPLERWVRFRTADFGSNQVFENEVLRLTNQARARGYNCDTNREGGPALPPLKRDPQLEVAALAQSAGMALHNYFNHVSSMDGSTPHERILASGFPASSTAENIAAGQDSPTEVVQGWLRSHGHCLNIMGQYSLSGISYVKLPGTEYGNYWTQAFANRR